MISAADRGILLLFVLPKILAMMDMELFPPSLFDRYLYYHNLYMDFKDLSSPAVLSFF